MTKKTRTIARLLMDAATGVSVEYVRKPGGALSHIEATYELGEVVLSITLHDLAEICDALGIERVQQEESYSNPDRGSTVVRPSREVDQLRLLQDTVFGPKGAETLKAVVSPKRFAWGVHRAVETLGITQLVELFGTIVEPEL